LISTASVTLSRLLDIDALPAFLDDLGFKAVMFSYPLTNLNSSFLGYRDSGVVDFTRAELIALFDKVTSPAPPRRSAARAMADRFTPWPRDCPGRCGSD
jgi:hypothetical protein